MKWIKTNMDNLINLENVVSITLAKLHTRDSDWNILYYSDSGDSIGYDSYASQEEADNRMSELEKLIGNQMLIPPPKEEPCGLQMPETLPNMTISNHPESFDTDMLANPIEKYILNGSNGKSQINFGWEQCEEKRIFDNIELSGIKGYLCDNRLIIFKCDCMQIQELNNQLYFQFPIPETLNDFIRDCQRCGIRLEFKQ